MDHLAARSLPFIWSRLRAPCLRPIAAASYTAMDSHLVQAVLFVFPEVLLVVTALYILVGRYVGLRLLELRRFRWLLVR